MFSHCLEEDTGSVTNKYVMNNFRLLPQCKWDLHSSEMLWNIDSVLCNIPEAWRSQVSYAHHKVENGNWQTCTCDLLSIYSNMHNILVSIKGNEWLALQRRKWKLFFWNMVQLLSIIPCFPASISPLLWSLNTTCLYIEEARCLKVNSEWGQVSINIHQQDHSETGSMYWIIKCIVQGKQAHVKKADLPHPSCTVVM